MDEGAGPAAFRYKPCNTHVLVRRVGSIALFVFSVVVLSFHRKKWAGPFFSSLKGPSIIFIDPFPPPMLLLLLERKSVPMILLMVIYPLAYW